MEAFLQTILGHASGAPSKMYSDEVKLLQYIALPQDSVEATLVELHGQK